MKENVLDVLMYLFENYMDDETEEQPDQESLKVELLRAGFPNGEIDKAFDWLEGLAAVQDVQPYQDGIPANSVRVFTKLEMEKLDVEARGFLLFLEQVGALDPVSRELVIDRVMALEDQIDLDQLKWIILLVLFNQPGQEAAFAWMEELVFDDQQEKRH